MAQNYFYGLGRRKSATARVRLGSGKGAFSINQKPSEAYLDSSRYLQQELGQPFAVLELDASKFDVSVRVNGGGHASQVSAMKLGLAKALAVMNEDYRSTLKKADLLGRDPRERERKKAGFLSARKKRQFTKR
jgi:small subunit ribosomal protein S9